MTAEFLKDYLPIILFLIIALGLSCAFIVINFILSPKNPDPEKITIKAYGAFGPKKFMGKEYEGIYRVSYLIDEDGAIEKVYNKVKPKEHAAQVLSHIA